MDRGVVAGLGLGLALVAWGIGGRDLGAFWDFPSILITLGGTLGATLVTYRMSDARAAARALRRVMRRDPPLADVIDTLVALAEKARREGLLTLDSDARRIRDPFLRQGMQLVVDGADPEVTRRVLEAELAGLEDRHRAAIGVFEVMGNSAPAFGLVGTLIGLVKMLRQLNDPSAIGPGMSVALLTTFYGAMFAFLFFNPVAAKLRAAHEAEVLVRTVMAEGILGIQSGENPRLLSERLQAFLPPRDRTEFDARRQATRKAVRA